MEDSNTGIRITEIDMNDPLALVRLLAMAFEEPNLVEETLDTAIQRADQTGIHAYHGMQIDLHGIIDTSHHLLKLIEFHPDLSKSEVIAALIPAQLRAFLGQIFDAYETLLSVVNPSGDPRVAEQQTDVLTQMRADREKILG